MAKLRVENVMPCDAATYWQINNDPDFEAFMAPRLDMRSYTEIRREERGGELYRRIKAEPDLHMPGPIEKVVRKQLGSAPVTYEEDRFIPREPGDPMVYRWEIHPPALQDRLKIYGRFIVEPIDDRSCRRILDASIEVSVFGIGGLIERFAGGEIRKSYDRMPGIVGAWIDRQGAA